MCICDSYHKYVHVFIHNVCYMLRICLIHTFTDLPSPIGLRTASRIYVTFFNILWNASNRIIYGDVSYEVSVFPPHLNKA